MGIQGHAGSARLVRPLVLLSWALAAVLAGSIVWWAVAAIGGEQGGARGKVFTQAQVAELASQPRDPGDLPSGSSTGSAVPSPDPEVTPDPVETAGPSTSAPTTDPSGGSSPAAPQPRPTATTPPAASPPAAASPARTARTWNVTGGQVGAQCEGGRIALLFATPHDGWTVELKHAGPEELEVKFRQGEAETSVRGVCTSGVPTMRTEDEHD